MDKRYQPMVLDEEDLALIAMYRRSLGFDKYEAKIREMEKYYTRTIDNHWVPIPYVMPDEIAETQRWSDDEDEPAPKRCKYSVVRSPDSSIEVNPFVPDSDSDNDSEHDSDNECDGNNKYESISECDGDSDVSVLIDKPVEMYPEPPEEITHTCI